MCFGSLSCWNIPPLPGSWSHLVDHVRDALYKCHLSNTLCTHAAPYHRTPTSSVSGLCVHSGSSGQVRAKRLVVHPILTFFFFPLSLFWSHQTKECAPTLHNVEHNVGFAFLQCHEVMIKSDSTYTVTTVPNLRHLPIYFAERQCTRQHFKRIVTVASITGTIALIIPADYCCKCVLTHFEQQSTSMHPFSAFMQHYSRIFKF